MATKCKVVKVAAHTRKCPATRKTIAKKAAVKKMSIIKTPQTTLAYRRGLVAKDGREQVTRAQYNHHIAYYGSKHGVTTPAAKREIDRRYVVSKKAEKYEEFIYERAKMGDIRSKL